MIENFSWPTWIGTPSQFGLLVVAIVSVVVAYIKVLPKMSELRIGSEQYNRAELVRQVSQATKDIKTCRDECAEQERKLQGQIDTLKTKINNEAWNRVQSEISLVHTLIQVVDAPQLKIILEALKQRSVTIPPEILESNEGADNGIDS